jgi:hypothetical protein
MEAEAIRLFRAFYARSNDKAPEPKRRKKGEEEEERGQEEAAEANGKEVTKAATADAAAVSEKG